MDNITQAQVKQAINGFLTAQFDKKATPLLKILEKASQDNDADASAKITADLKKAKEKYALDTWMEYASAWMSQQLSFGTHISKGIHASSKGDNVIYTPSASAQDSYIVGHHSVKNPITDASGNAAALPLAAFIQTQVSEEANENSNITLGGLIRKQHVALHDAFHSNPETSQQIYDIFYKLVIAHLDTPTTDEMNKQILWPIVDNCQPESDTRYHCLIPLYPTSLTHDLYEKIQDIKFSEVNTLAKKNRNKVTESQTSYTTIKDLAIITIGGSNPQGVSQLMSKKRGKTYLLPSMPPTFAQTQDLSFSKNTSSIFNAKTMAYKTRKTLDALYKIIQTDYNNVTIRDARQSLVDELLLQILAIASSIQNNRPAGWSTAYNLNYAEKLWLDPHRRALESEEDFRAEFEKGYWQQEIEVRFAAWLQDLLRKELPRIKNNFADTEHNQWEREMATALKESQRLGQGAFA